MTPGKTGGLPVLIKHDELVAYLKQFTDAPTLLPEEVDFDISAADSMSVKRMVRKTKGSWYQIPKDIEPNER